MRKGMLFFSQYRTPCVIFLKNLKKYLHFVTLYRCGAFFAGCRQIGARFGPGFATTGMNQFIPL